jgi:ribosomal protein S18 acetylase RimI-like enzyme
VELIARLATSDDLSAATELLTEATTAVSSERGGALFLSRESIPEPLEQNLAHLLSDPQACVAVGVAEGVTVALAICRLETLPGACLARLEFLWVEVGFREVGLGADLLVLLTEWAEAMGATHFDAYALPGNREAKNFLEAAGFSARLIVMNRPLGPTTPRREARSQRSPSAGR